MVTRQTKPKVRPPRDPQAPRGQLEALARRKGGYGYSITPHVLFRFSGQLHLKPFDLLVLLGILSHASPNATDSCTASFEVLASDTGLDRKTVVRHVNRLRDELKLLSSSNKRTTDKRLTANTYNVQPLAEKLKAMMAEAPQEAADGEVDLDSIIAELMAEPGPDMDPADSGGVEVPASPPRKGKSGWATKEKDPVDDDALDDERADRSAGRSRTAKATPRTASPSTARRPDQNTTWYSRSRMRSPELDEPDRAQLERGERLRHPGGRELSVYEHIQRMRELEITQDERPMLLMDLRFPNAEITTAMNANPVEFIGGLAGVTPAVQEPAKEPDGPWVEPVPPDADPVTRDAIDAINWIHLKTWKEKHGKS